MTALLEIRGLDLYYGDAQALDGVSLDLYSQQIVAIVGANGAGKTSLIRAIAGIERPRSGTVRFSGREIGRLESHEICNLGIGQVAEGRQIFSTLTVGENLKLGAALPRARAQSQQSLEEVYALFPRLEERSQQIAGTLSGGEQQMLAIGRCLMSRPELIMLDEPSLGLAPNLTRGMLQAIRRLHERGMTILLVEQNVALSLDISHYAYVLENGRMVMSGSGHELLNDARVRQAYLGL
jgi:branched-chain amino acid transport system ATP-binding protein